MTYTEEIFSTNYCPYDHELQGRYPRYLFVCSAGLLRSPTAATLAARYGINARSAGSNNDFALIPVNRQLIEWAHVIVFMTDLNLKAVLKHFKDDDYYVEVIKSKAEVWGIEDDYRYMEPKLVALIERKLNAI